MAKSYLLQLFSKAENWNMINVKEIMIRLWDCDAHLKKQTKNPKKPSKQQKQTKPNQTKTTTKNPLNFGFQRTLAHFNMKSQCEKYKATQSWWN